MPNPAHDQIVTICGGKCRKHAYGGKLSIDAGAVRMPEMNERLRRYLAKAESAPMDPAPCRRVENPASVSREFLGTMQARRTIRQFSSKPVPWELVENAVRTAMSAPSGANQQPWTYVLVSDPKTKATLREAIEIEEHETYAKRASDEWLEALAPLGTDWHKEHITSAPFLAIVFAQTYGIAAGEDGNVRKIKHYYVQESVGISVGFFLASLTSAGLSTLTHTPNPMGFLREFFCRPQNERAFVVIPIGYASDDARVPRITKKPLDQVLIRD
jgi:iodotyrosine deiodinase